MTFLITIALCIAFGLFLIVTSYNIGLSSRKDGKIHYHEYTERNKVIDIGKHTLDVENLYSTICTLRKVTHRIECNYSREEAKIICDELKNIIGFLCKTLGHIPNKHDIIKSCLFCNRLLPKTTTIRL